MFDIKWIRENPQAFDAGLARRALPPAAAELIQLDDARRDTLTRVQELQAERNRISKEIGLRKAKKEDVADLMEQVSKSKAREAELDQEAQAAGAKLDERLSVFPNLLDADVPEGRDESANVEIRRWGEPKDLGFKAKDHVEIGEGLGLMDFERASKLSGARFVVLTGALARLERALAAFMLDLHTGTHGYTEVNPPAMVKSEVLYGTGQLPKFGEDLFRTTQGLWLIPTAEVPLTNLVANEILPETDLPKRLTAMTWCFRSEAGAAGKDTRGMIRQHQFTKVELVSVVHPDKSGEEHERMTASAEEVLKRLGLPYRVIVLCAGDTGFGARKTYDIEVWLAGQGRYREISSCSNCGDFQARRMMARFRPGEGKGTRFVHTLNGSGVAVGRAMVAILENYQQADGSVVVPEALRSYMGGLEVIASHGR
jgi:seryl-tRNA synthetase